MKKIGWIFVFTSCPIYFVSHAQLNQLYSSKHVYRTSKSSVTTRPQENCCDVKWGDVVFRIDVGVKIGLEHLVSSQ